MSTALQHPRGEEEVVPLSVVNTDGEPVGGTPTGGTFTLGYNGLSTGGLNYNATALQVQNALVALSTIGTGNATASGGPPPAAYVVEFAQGLGDPEGLVVTDYFTGGMNVALAVAVSQAYIAEDAGAQEAQTLTVSATSGTYALSYDGVSYTTAIAFDADNFALEAALNTLLGVATVSVGGAGPFNITWTAVGNRDTLQVQNNTDGTVDVAVSQEGSPAVAFQAEQQTVSTTSDVPTVYVTKDGAYQVVSTNTAVSTGYAFAITLTATEKTADAVGLTLVCPTGFFGRSEWFATTNEPANFSALSIEAVTGRVDVAKIEGVDASNMLSTVGPSATQIANTTAATLASAHGAGSWATATGFSTHSAADVVTALGTGTTLTALATAANLAVVAGYLDTEIQTIIGYVDCLPATWVVPAAVGAAMTLTTSERNATADAVLVRSASHVEATADPHSLCYVILAMSEADTTTHADKMTVFRTNGVTEFVQKTLATTTQRRAVTGVS